MAAVGRLQRCTQFGRCLCALHRCGIHHHGQVRHTSVQRGDDVAQRRRPQRSDHTNAARLWRQRPFAGRIKQPLGFKPCLEAQEFLEQCPLAGGLEAVHDQLQVAAWTVHIEFSLGLHHLPVARGEAQLFGRAAKQGTADLPGVVLEREVTMPAGRARETGNLSTHRHRVEARGQSVRNGAHERPNRPDTARRCCIRTGKWLRHRALQTKSVHNPRDFLGGGPKDRAPSGPNAKPLKSKQFLLPVLSSNCLERGLVRLEGWDGVGSSQSYPQNLCIAAGPFAARWWGWRSLGCGELVCA